jgi:hypothetical protein
LRTRDIGKTDEWAGRRRDEAGLLPDASRYRGRLMTVLRLRVRAEDE